MQRVSLRDMAEGERWCSNSSIRSLLHDDQYSRVISYSSIQEENKAYLNHDLLMMLA